ncbi:hypothetical protein [Desulfobacter postgatei]|uniref:hypothetical protein n=1 Tax=Desulfobacter postgatei TaxID=2293 RepID=UPI00259BBBD7|nr:hypothetical protein [uncultured Desulfobacter sp.]
MTLLHHKDPTRKGNVLSPGRVSIKDLVTQAVIADATDGAALKELGVKNVDTAVFCSDRKKGWTH